MGLRSLERRFLPAIRLREVEDIVNAYVRLCDENMVVMNPVKYLKQSLLDAGLNPPGLQAAVRQLASLRPRTPRRVILDAKGGLVGTKTVIVGGGTPYERPDADQLIELLLDSS